VIVDEAAPTSTVGRVQPQVVRISVGDPHKAEGSISPLSSRVSSDKAKRFPQSTFYPDEALGSPSGLFRRVTVRVVENCSVPRGAHSVDRQGRRFL